MIAGEAGHADKHSGFTGAPGPYPRRRYLVRKREQTFPALDTAEAEHIVGELARALDSDREWGEDFRSMLVCRSKPKASYFEADSHKETAFGRWYYGQVNSNICDHPGFTEAGKNSERMHALARDLVCAIRDGEDIKPLHYNAFVASVDRFRSGLRLLLSEAWDFLRYTDPLTGLMTRSAMQKRLEEEQDRARRSGQVNCLVMMDMDHFKKINDTHGHQAGDQVLETIAGYVQEKLRRYDLVFRYGGEEFLILLPNTTTAKAKSVLDRLRQNIKRQAIKIGRNTTVHISASFGVAELLPDNPPKDSIDLADQALYEAKNAGRNRVRVWQDAET